MVEHVAKGFIDYIQDMVETIGDPLQVPAGLQQSNPEVGWAFTNGIITAKLGERTDQNDPELPDCWISVRETTIERISSENTGAIMHNEMEVVLDFAIRSYDQLNDLLNLTHDVQYLFGNDPRLGGTCLNTEIVGVSTSMLRDEAPLCGIDVVVLVSFRFDQTDPSTLA